MKIEIYRQEECFKAKGLCVVIDVLRAFTTAAYAFAAGAKEILLVSSVEEAFRMHREDHSLILMGEQGGLPFANFTMEIPPLNSSWIQFVGELFSLALAKSKMV
jgi:2-phosphosulfolactate phosphatase